MFDRDYPKKNIKTVVDKVLFFGFNFKLSDLNRLIVLHKSAAQNKCYFNIVGNNWPKDTRNWQKNGHEKVFITGTC
jgi:hypothetical protein